MWQKGLGRRDYLPQRERRRGRANGPEGSEDAELRVEGLTHAEMGENAPPEAGEAEGTDCLPEPSWGAQPAEVYLSDCRPAGTQGARVSCF